MVSSSGNCSAPLFRLRATCRHQTRTRRRIHAGAVHRCIDSLARPRHNVLSQDLEASSYDTAQDRTAAPVSRTALVVMCINSDQIEASASASACIRCSCSIRFPLLFVAIHICTGHHRHSTHLSFVALNVHLQQQHVPPPLQVSFKRHAAHIGVANGVASWNVGRLFASGVRVPHIAIVAVQRTPMALLGPSIIPKEVQG